jgi:hypothetical protein
MGFKLRPGTSVFGNVTFDPELANRYPVLSGIDSSYVLTQGQDLIISGSATDPDEDDINWSFEQKFEGSKIIVVADAYRKIYVYDSSDLSTPISTLSPEGNLGNPVRIGNGVHSDDQYIYVSSIEDTSPRRGIISIYDKNDLSATPITLTPQTYFGSGAQAQYDVGSGSITLANYSNTFISDGDKLYISNNEIPIPRSDNSGLGGYGVVYVYDKTNWSSPPVILNALDNPNVHHSTNTKYFGRGFGKSISIYGSNLYVTRGYPSAPDVWDNGFFVYDINDLSATPSYFDANVDQTTFVDRDWGHRMETTENHIFVSCHGADANGHYNGLVYAYNRSDLNQLPTEILSPVSGIDQDAFGYTLHTSEDYLIVHRRDYGSDGTNTYNGLVEIYDINTFNHVTTLNPSIEMKSDDGDANFGFPMFVSGTNLVIGVQGAKVDNIEDAGTVLIYDLSDLSSPPSQIKEENLQESSSFGSHITMSSAAESVNYSSQGITISQSNNVFTITPGEQSATFQIEFTATDSKGASTSTTSSFEYTYSIGDYSESAPAPAPEPEPEPYTDPVWPVLLDRAVYNSTEGTGSGTLTFGDWTYGSIFDNGQGTRHPIGTVTDQGLRIQAPHWSGGDWWIEPDTSGKVQVEIIGRYDNFEGSYSRIDLFLTNGPVDSTDTPDLVIVSEGTQGSDTFMVYAYLNGNSRITIRTLNTINGVSTIEKVTLL